MPLLLTLAWVVPPWTNTDEPFHMLRAVSLAHGQVIGSRFDNHDPAGPAGSGGLSDMAIFEAFGGLARISWLPGQPDGQVTAALLARADAVKWRKALVPVWFGSTAQYPPWFYVPDIAGYWIGRAGGLHVDATLRLARCLNAIVFLALAAAAIARARRLRPLLVVLLMLPMTLALASSASQDAGMIAAMALTVAQLDRIADAGRAARAVELFCIAACLGCVAMARPPYVALLLIVPLVAPGPLGRWAEAGAGACVVLWCGLVAAFVMRAPGVADPAAQAALILANPWHLLAVAANTVRDSGGTYAWEFIGRLAWNDVPLPAAYQALAWAAVAASAAASCAGPALARRAVLAAAAIATAGIFALLYMDWTAPGADHVDGVVGRYFLPLALTLGLALPQIRPHASSRWLASALVALMGTTTPAIMLHHIVWHFFLPA